MKRKRLILLFIIFSVLLFISSCVYIPIHYREFSSESKTSTIDEWEIRVTIYGGLFYSKKGFNEFNDYFFLDINLITDKDKMIIQNDSIYISNIKIKTEDDNIIKGYPQKYLAKTDIYPSYEYESYTVVKIYSPNTKDIHIDRNVNTIFVMFNLELIKCDGEIIKQEFNLKFIRNDHTNWEWRLIGD